MLHKAYFCNILNQAGSKGLSAPKRWPIHQIHPQGACRYSAQKSTSHPRPPFSPCSIDLLAQTPPKPRPCNKPGTAAQTKQCHGQCTLPSPTTECGNQQGRIKQSTRHQSPKKTSSKNTARCSHNRANPVPNTAASTLNPSRLACLQDHHQSPCQHSHMHQCPRWPQGCGLLCHPGQTLHGHGGQRADAGISKQAPAVVCQQLLRLSAPLYPAYRLFGRQWDRACRRLGDANTDHRAARCSAHGEAMGSAHQPHDKSGGGKRKEHWP